MSERHWLTSRVVLAAVGLATVQGPVLADYMIANADTATPAMNVGPVRVRIGKPDGDPATDGCYRISPLKAGGSGSLVFVLPKDVDPSKFTGIAASIRAVPPGDVANAARAARVRLVALDQNNRMVLQRSLDLDPAAPENEVSLPWTKWRWGEPTFGGPSEVRKVGLRVEAVAADQEVELDDLRFTEPAEGEDPPTGGKEWLRRLAFEDRDVRVAEADGLLVATDATEGLTDADLLKILGRMRQARALVRRVFGDAVRPVEGTYPPALLIFRENEDHVSFFRRLGEEWNAQIAPPTHDGVTVHDIATSTFDPKQGANRPSYAHEAVHAVIGRDVRLAVGRNNTSWLHEGFASYVQLCIHPASISRNPFPAEFAKPVAPDGSTFFKPLSQLLAGRVSTRNYAQLATVVAFLVEEKPQWLPLIARELAAGHDADKALAACGSSVADLEKEWLAWGRVKFPMPDKQGGARAAGARAAGARAAAARPLFDVPAELRAEPAASTAGEAK
jgi:hypothetical protein